MPSLHEKCRYGKVFSVFVPKLRNKKRRCFALPQIAFAKGKKRKKAACKRKRLYGAVSDDKSEPKASSISAKVIVFVPSL